MRRDLDETRDFTENLDEDEKKNMFSRFVDGGGQVEDPNKYRRKQMVNQDSRTPEANETEERRRSRKSRKKSEQAVLNIPKADKRTLGKRINLFFERMRLYFRSSINNVIDSSGKYFSPKFLGLLNKDAQNRLLDLQLLITPIIHGDQALLKKIQTELFKQGDLYYELLVRMEGLYNERDFPEIVSRYAVNPEARVTPMEVAVPLRNTYKRFYVLRTFSVSCRNAITTALEVQANHENKDKVALKRNINHAKKDLAFIFSELVPKLHLAVLNILKRNFYPGHKKLENFLELGLQDEVGYITHRMAREIRETKEKQQKVMDDKKVEIKEERQDIKVDKLDTSIQDGLRIMRRIKPQIQTERGKDSPLGYLKKKDKMYHVNILFNEMEREYSFILTSNQIKISVDYHSGKKVDIKEELSDYFIEFNHARELIDEFNSIAKECWETEKDTSLTMIQRSKAIHSLSIKRTKLERQCRDRLGKLLEKIGHTLQRLLSDHEQGEQHLLQNPEETIHFEIAFEEQKKLEGVTVLEAIRHTLNFIKAFRYRLQEGDLSGLGAEIDRHLSFDDSGANFSGADRQPPQDEAGGQAETNASDDAESSEPSG